MLGRVITTRLDRVPGGARQRHRAESRPGRSRRCVALWAALFACAAPGTVRGADAVRETVARGDAAMQQERYETAIRLYDEARGMVDPARTRVLAGLLFKKALALREAGETLVAIATIELAQHYHEEDVYEQVRASLDLEASGAVADARQIAGALRVARGFPPTSASAASVSVWVDFGFDSADLTRRGERQLSEMAIAMRGAEFGGNGFRLVGHTDARGSERYNQELSERRARRVADRLARVHGFDRARLEAEGRGETEPRAKGGTEADHARNRRVELRLLPAGRSR